MFSTSLKLAHYYKLNWPKKGHCSLLAQWHITLPLGQLLRTKLEKIANTKNRIGRTNPLIVDQQLSPRILGEVHLKIAFWSSDVFPLCPPTKEVHYLKSHFFSPFSAIITFSWQPLEDKNIGQTHFFLKNISWIPISIFNYIFIFFFKLYLGKCSNNQNGNLRWHLPLGVRPPPP